MLKRLILEHGDFLHGYAKMRIESEADREDVLQETFLAAVEAFSKYRHESTERTWLIGILRHKIYDYYRKKSREVGHISYDASLDASNTTNAFFDKRGYWRPEVIPGDLEDFVLKKLESEQLMSSIQDCIHLLPQKMRLAYILREFEHKESLEICEILDIKENHLNVLMHRARLNLRICLGKYGNLVQKREAK